MHADYTVQEALCTVHALFIGPTTNLFRKKKKWVPQYYLNFLKKIMSTVFSVFSKISYIQTNPNYLQNKL